MQVKLYRKTIILWSAPCNSSIDNKQAAIFTKEIGYLETGHIPQVSEIIMIGENKYVVDSIIRTIVKNGNIYFNESFNIYLKPQKIYVDYYSFMKKYTHKLDKMKAPGDPTIDLSKINDKIQFPESLKEWEEKIKNL